MKDIGLGILDPYTVVIVLVTLVLAQVLFGYQIPLDTTNATQLFVSLVIFTGYIYLARSIYRLPIAIIKSWIFNNERYDLTHSFPKIYPGLFNFWYWVKDLFRTIVRIPFILASLLLPIINFSNENYDEKYPSHRIQRLQENTWLVAVLSTLDRLGIIGIAIIATTSKFQLQVQTIGIYGVLFMIVLYVFKGNFVALIGDGLEKVVEKQLRQKGSELTTQDAQRPIEEQKEETNRLGGPAIRTSKCRICGKTCSEDGYRRVPIICSMECAQKWFVEWDKDWLIGVNHERALINSLRHSGYRDSSEVDKVIKQLKEIPSERSVWTLLAIVRDCYGINFQVWHENIQSKVLHPDIPWAKTENHLRSVLDFSVLDEDDIVVSTSLFLIDQLDIKQITDNHIEALLKSKFFFDQIKGIELLGQLLKPDRLFELFGEEEKNTDPYVLKALAACGDWGVSYLTRARRSPKVWFREAAADTLKSLGIEEPFSVKDEIHCPECSLKVDINYPDNIVITGQFYRTNFVKEFFRKSDFKVQCPYCYSMLGVDTMSVQAWKQKQHPTFDNVGYVGMGAPSDVGKDS